MLTPMISEGGILYRDEDGLITHPDLREHLLSPFHHLRGLLRDIKALLDATGDQSVDVKPAQQLIRALEALVGVCREAFQGKKTEEDVAALVDLLSWSTGTLPVRVIITARRFILIISQANLDLSHTSRRMLHKGTLHYPIDPSGTRVSIDDRGSSVQVFVVLLDNCRRYMSSFRCMSADWSIQCL